MRLAATSFILALSATAFIAGPAAAQPDKYCLQGFSSGYPGNCSFSSFAQCRATASGTVEGCGINPRYAYARQGGYSRRGHRRY